MRTINAIILTLAILSPACGADCVRLNYASLPSAQGWLYLPDLPLPPDVAVETNAFSVDGTKLTVNTIGPNGTNLFAFYTLRNVVPTNQPYTLTVRARVLESRGDSVFYFQVDNPDAGRVAFALTTNSLSIAFAGGGGSHTRFIDGTQFHNYRLEGQPGEWARLFVDDVFWVEGVPGDGDDNEVVFGTGVLGGGTRVEITQLEFCQRRGPTVSASLASVDVCWDSLSNRLYQVQYRSSVTTNQWANLGIPVAGNGTTNCVTDTVRGVVQRFYRAVETPQ